MEPALKERSGQSLVEMAISMMIIVLLLLGAIETSMALFQYVTIRDAAQEGAVYASTHPLTTEEDDIKYRTIAAASDFVALTSSDITVERSAECEGSALDGTPNTIKVKIVYIHEIIFPIVGGRIDPIPLTAGVTNVILSPKCAP